MKRTRAANSAAPWQAELVEEIDCRDWWEEVQQSNWWLSGEGVSTPSSHSEPSLGVSAPLEGASAAVAGDGEVVDFAGILQAADEVFAAVPAVQVVQPAHPLWSQKPWLKEGMINSFFQWEPLEATAAILARLKAGQKLNVTDERKARRAACEKGHVDAWRLRLQEAGLI